MGMKLEGEMVKSVRERRERDSREARAMVVEMRQQVSQRA